MLSKFVDTQGQTHIVNTTHIHSIDVKNSGSDKLMIIIWDNETKTTYYLRPYKYTDFINTIIKESI